MHAQYFVYMLPIQDYQCDCFVVKGRVIDEKHGRMGELNGIWGVDCDLYIENRSYE